MKIYSPEADSYFLSDAKKKFFKRQSKEKIKKFRVLEIGSGSGIQLTTFFSLGILRKNIFACDINSQAVKHCKALGFNCIQSNLFSKIKGKYDLIIFNPPYLPNTEYDSEKDTSGGKKGSEVVNRFLNQAREYLKTKGKVLILVSSLTQGTNFKEYNRKLVAEKKFFFEKLFVYELWPIKSSKD